MPTKRNQPKGMSPKHVRRAHITRSTGNDDPIFCVTTFDKYELMTAKDKKAVRDDTKKKLELLEAMAARDEMTAKRRLIFPNKPGSSADHATSGSPPKKKKNNKGDDVVPDSPDCGLTDWHPARDGTRSSKRIAAYSPSPQKGLSKKPMHVD
jgi:hypothetical protein